MVFDEWSMNKLQNFYSPRIFQFLTDPSEGQTQRMEIALRWAVQQPDMTKLFIQHRGEGVFCTRVAEQARKELDVILEPEVAEQIRTMQAREYDMLVLHGVDPNLRTLYLDGESEGMFDYVELPQEL